MNKEMKHAIEQQLKRTEKVLGKLSIERQKLCAMILPYLAEELRDDAYIDEVHGDGLVLVYDDITYMADHLVSLIVKGHTDIGLDELRSI